MRFSRCRRNVNKYRAARAFSSSSSSSPSLSSRDREILSLSLVETANALRRNDFTVTDLASASFRQANRLQQAGYNAYDEQLMHAAQIAQTRLREHQAARLTVDVDSRALLLGIPLAIKDSFCTQDMRTTAGSRMLANFQPPYDASVVESLRAAGALLMGKTNLDEFAMGSYGKHGARGPTRNVRMGTRVAGGSSSGSAAAVAGGAVAAALGSDTGGSVRLPAAFSGLVGLKPSYGRVPRRGLIAYASSLDCPGVLTRTVADAEAVLEVIARSDARDATTAGVEPLPATSAVASASAITSSRLRVGLPAEYAVRELSEAARSAWNSAAEAFRRAGASLVTVSLPHTPFALPAYYIIASAEASSNLARYDGIRYGHRANLDTASTCSTNSDRSAVEALYRVSRSEGFGEEVQRRILTGTFALTRGSYDSYCVKAQAVRRLVAQDFERVFQEQCDVLLTPAAVGVAPRLDAPANSPTSEYVSDVMTIGASLAGLPALVLPTALSTQPHSDGQLELPLAVQLIAPRFHERRLLHAARTLETALAFTLPPMLDPVAYS